MEQEKIPTRQGWDIGKWWNRGESNPRPQAITGRFYMRSCLI